MSNVYGTYWAPINGRAITWRKDGRTVDIPVGEFGDYVYKLMFSVFPLVHSGGPSEIFYEEGYKIPVSNRMVRLSDK